MKRALNFLSGDAFLKVASLLIAIILWAFVSTTIIPELDVVISDIPITISLKGTAAESAGLEVVEGAKQTVSVAVKGKRYVVGNLTKDDIVVTGQVGNITEAGVYTIALTATEATPSDDYEIVSVRPGEVSMTFDRVKSKKFKVETMSKGITVPEGYIVSKASSSVTEVTVSGTEEDLARVARVVAKVTVTGQLTKTVEEDVTLVLMDESGQEITNHKMSLSKEKTVVTVSVLKLKKVSLAAEYINVPTGLKTDLLPSHFSVDQLNIAGPADTVDAISTINIGYIDVSKIKPGEEFQFDLDLPSGFVCVDDVTSITVTFPLSEYASDYFRVTNIRVANVPDGYKATVVSYGINYVQMVGTKDVMNALTAEDLVAEIDLSATDFVQGNNTLKASILAGGKTAFAAGNYTAIVKIEKI